MADVAPIKFYGCSKRNAVVPIDTKRPEWLAALFARPMRQTRNHIPRCGSVALGRGFMGDGAAPACGMRAKPDILNHNIETVPGLYPHFFFLKNRPPPEFPLLPPQRFLPT